MIIRRYGTNPVPKGITRTWSKESGWQTVMTWEGSERVITALAQQLKGDGSAESVSVSGSPPLLTVSATYGNQPDSDEKEEMEEVWEFPSNTVTTDILAHPLATGLSHLVLSHLRALRDDTLTRATGSQVSKDKDGTDAFHWSSTAADASIDLVYGDNGSGDGLKLVNLIMAGVESCQESQTVVSISATVSGSYGITLSNSLTGKVLAPATFVTMFDPPDDVRFTIPTTGLWTAGTGWTFGYLAQKPDIAMVGGGKWRIVQEFWCGYWANTLYPVHTV